MYPVADAVGFAQVFVETAFSGEPRHARRLQMIAEYERTGELPPEPAGELAAGALTGPVPLAVPPLLGPPRVPVLRAFGFRGVPVAASCCPAALQWLSGCSARRAAAAARLARRRVGLGRAGRPTWLRRARCLFQVAAAACGAGGEGTGRDGSGRGGRGRADGRSFAACSAAASCSGRGRDTSRARMAASSVIFIPGIGILHRYPFPPDPCLSPAAPTR